MATEYISCAEAARRIGISPSGVAQYVREGRIKGALFATDRSGKPQCVGIKRVAVAQYKRDVKKAERDREAYWAEMLAALRKRNRYFGSL